MGLSIAKRSTSSYNFLSSHIVLPGATTNNSVLKKIPCSTGLTDVVLHKLKELSGQLEEKEKYVSLIWDEVHLSLHTQYDKSQDMIVGFEDWGHKRTANFADHAIVFQIRGINSGWTMPVFYGFCSSLTSAPELMRCIKEVVTAVEATGFHILTTICDQSSTNRVVIKKFIEQSNAQRRKNNIQERE